MDIAEIINNTGHRIYWVCKNGKIALGFIDHGQCVTSGNHNDDGIATIESFRISDDPNAKRLWLDRINTYGMTDEQVEEYMGTSISDM